MLYKRMSLQERRWYNKITLCYKILDGILPDYMQSYMEASFQNKDPLRSISARKLKALPSRTESFKNETNLNYESKMQNLYVNSKNQLSRKFFI